MTKPRRNQPSHHQQRRIRARRRLAFLFAAIFLAGGLALVTVIWSLRTPPNKQSATNLDGDVQGKVILEAQDGGGDLEDELQSMPVPETAAAELWGPPDPFIRYNGTLSSGDTVATALEGAGVPGPLAARILATLRGTLDFRRVRPNDVFELLATKQGELLEFRYARGIDEIYTVKPLTPKWVVVREKRQFERKLALVQGFVETTLFDAIAAVGERPELIMSFVEIFAWTIDFSVATRKGDSFQMLCEKLYDKGMFKGYGRIFAARYVNQGEAYSATYFEAPDGFSGYFDERGRNLRRAFLRAPLRFNLITSGFTTSRFHPVLKFRRPHLGIDYAAPTGTPIWSVADGVVTGAGWMGGSGRAVKIRHNHGYETSYSHLSRIAPGIRPGVRVRQRQVIGYVGATGLATGPHLHYGMKIHGRAINPAAVRLPAGDPVPRKYLAQFQTERARYEAEMARLVASTPRP